MLFINTWSMRGQCWTWDKRTNSLVDDQLSNQLVAIILCSVKPKLSFKVIKWQLTIDWISVFFFLLIALKFCLVIKSLLNIFNENHFPSAFISGSKLIPHLYWGLIVCCWNINDLTIVNCYQIKNDQINQLKQLVDSHFSLSHPLSHCI